MKRFFLLALLLAAGTSPAFGWGVLGHRVVGRIAEAELEPAARAEVARLLAGEADPTLAGVSAWADEVRAKDPVLGRRSAPWHYVTLHSPDCAYARATDCANGDCVVGAIEAQAAILADRRRLLAERRQALKFVVHFVGDVHQPLHANNKGDKGGNTVQIRVPGAGGGERGSNLHSWWDSGMLKASGVDEDALVARLAALPLAVAIARAPLPAEAGPWAEQSCRIAAAPGFYPASAHLAAHYRKTWMPTAETRMRQAGARLARVLNAALAD